MSPYEPLLKSVEKTAATEEASLFGGGTDAWETVVGTVLLLDELGFVLFRAEPNRNYGGSQYHRNKKRAWNEPDQREFLYRERWSKLIHADNAERIDKFTPADRICLVMDQRVCEVETDGADGDALRELLAELGVVVFLELASPGGGSKFLIARHPALFWVTPDKEVAGWPHIEVKPSGNFTIAAKRPKYDGRGYRVVDNNIHLLRGEVDNSGTKRLADYLLPKLPPKREHVYTAKIDVANVTDRDVRYALAVVERACEDFAKVDTGRWQAGNNCGLRIGHYAWALVGHFGGAEQAHVYALGCYMDACERNGYLDKRGRSGCESTFNYGFFDGVEEPRERPDTDDQKVDPGPSGIEHLGITRLSDVEPKQVDWLWHKRLPKGKVVVLDGDPEIGKSTMAINLAAVVTTGGSWPDGRECRYPGNVVMLSGEDGTADTLVPRVMAAGGRRDRFFQYEGVKYKGADGQTYVRMSTLDDCRNLELVIRHLDARLVIVDVLMAFMPDDKNANRDQDMRSVLRPLAKIADETGCTILVLRHLNKSPSGNVMYRGGGSIGIIGAARLGMIAAYMPGQDEVPVNDRVRALGVYKSNLASTPETLTYRLTDANMYGVARVEWIDSTELDGTDLLTETAKGLSSEVITEVGDCVEWLEEVMFVGYPYRSKDIKEAARKADFSGSTLDRATDRIGMRKVRTGFPSHTYWTIPESANKPASQAVGSRVTSMISMPEMTGASDATEVTACPITPLTPVTSLERVSEMTAS